MLWQKHGNDYVIKFDNSNLNFVISSHQVDSVRKYLLSRNVSVPLEMIFQSFYNNDFVIEDVIINFYCLHKSRRKLPFEVSRKRQRSLM